MTFPPNLDHFGGFLRCEVCGNTSYINPGDTGRSRYLEYGWPRCCNLTMRWWTQNQINNGEAR